MSSLSIAAPADYQLARDVCSYGYFVLAPNHWDPASRTLYRVLSLREGTTSSRPVLIAITQRCTKLNLTLSRTVTAAERDTIRAQVTRMLRLDESAQRLAQFHARDPRFKASGKGRLFRSPTLFEDVIKTVTSCNVQWPGTVTMNRRLCEVLGSPVSLAGVTAHAFPTAHQLARARPSTLRSRCRVGYRDTRLVELAKLFTLPPTKGGIDQTWLTSDTTSDDALFKYLVKLPGIGPYAAANIMQLLGRYAKLPLDTESARHGKHVLGFKGSAAQLAKQVRNHFAPFGIDAFRSYWFELWTHYEATKGPAHTWQRETIGRTFVNDAAKAMKTKPAR